MGEEGQVVECAGGRDQEDIEAGDASPFVAEESNSATPGVSADVTSSSNQLPSSQPEIEIEPSLDSESKLLPVLIFPGFMSSGLEVKKSGVSKEWEGLRVWLNLEKLGIKVPLHAAGALEQQPPGTTGAAAAHQRRFSESIQQEHERGLRCKSDWLQHVSLSHDLVTERQGMEVRAIEGLHGVDYLGQHERQFMLQNLINSCTYVFGPVIKVLRKAGYTDENLDAAPYDWRLPPKVLEERDQYFSRTMRKIEDMYKRNNDTPVVLVGHSMGCRICHYFLNFALESPNGGRDWLDKYVHTYMPVGAPHLGAPKALRGIVDGDKMGLDAFVSDEEGLILGRSLGSALFLLPHMLPSRNAPPNVVLRTEGALCVTVSPIDCKELLGELESDEEIPKIQLQIKYGDKVLRTGFQQPVGDKLTIHFSQRFVFPAPPNLTLNSEGGLDALRITLRQPGIDKAAKTAYKISDHCAWIAPLVWIVDCIIVMLKFILFGTYLLFRRMCTPKGSPMETLPGVQDIKDAAEDSGTKLASCTLAQSAERHLSSVLAGNNEAKVEIDVMKKARRRYFQHTSVPVECDIWFGNPIVKSKEMESVCSPIANPINPAREMARHGLKDTSDGCLVTNKKDKYVSYEPAAGGKSLLIGEGMNYIFDVINKNYDADPLGPRTHSAKDPPPVKRVEAIYGINLPTEVGAVYRRASLFLENGRLQRLHELDTSATMKKNMESYKIRNGIIMELKTTPQVIVGPTLSEDRRYSHSDAKVPKKQPLPVRVFNSQANAIQEHATEGELVLRCGDGTVPYWSLQHCRTWQGPCDVGVTEIEGAEHREILANSIFHKVLIDYVSQGSVKVSVKPLSSLAK